MPWTDKQIAKMKALYAKGLSCSEIGTKLGMSKNMVVGKINRLGLNNPAKAAAVKAVKTAKKPAPKPVAKAAAPKKAAAKAVKPAPKAPVKKPAAKPAAPAKPLPKVPKKLSEKIQERSVNHALAMAALGHDQCRWPIGSTSSDDFHFCGKKVFPGKPYCFEHCKMSYVMQPAAPKDAKK